MMKNRLVQNAKIVDKFLIQYLRRQDKSLLISPMKYGVISGGKKIRSTIIFDTGKIFNIKKKFNKYLCKRRMYSFLLFNS